MTKFRYFIPKVINRLAAEKNLLWKYRDIERVSCRGYVAFQDAESLRNRLISMLGVYDSTLLADLMEKERALIMHSARQTLRHEFDLLGSGIVKLDPVDWHIDFKSGERWEKGFYRDLTTPKGADIKVPWELSRCQHLLWLGEAWLLTGQDAFAQEIISQINSWIDDNPLMYSVNWKCSMDVAFRSVNWMYALNMISSYKGFDDNFAEKVSHSLWQHGFYIINNLEKVVPYSNNHYTSDLVGLLYLGELFSESRVARKWLRIAYKEYSNELHKQILPSGVHYERSVSYHRLMVEMMSYPLYMLQRVGHPVEQSVIDIIKKMYDYVSVYTKPNGLAPLIADNDDGRFLPFVCRDFREHTYLIDTQSAENRIVALGLESFCLKASINEILYEDAGVAIIHKGNDYLYINNGGYSKCPKSSDMIIGTHTHNDLLSFELALSGIDVLVDSGTYLYTSSVNDRNEFRSTSKHNTAVVDEEEQNGLVLPFYLKRNVQIGKLKKHSDGCYVGDYRTIAGGMQHERSFDFYDGQLKIVDSLAKIGQAHVAKLYFHFAEGLLPEIKDDSIVFRNGIKLMFDSSPSRLEIIDDTISPSFGRLVKSKTAIVTYQFDDHINITTTIIHGNQQGI